MDNIRIFESEKFGKIRTIPRDDGPWFVAADVCRALELSDVSMSLKRLDDDEKGTSSVGTPGGDQQMSIISEPGLYALVLSSRKPEAHAFKRWITHEVIPALRKTGHYSTSFDAITNTFYKIDPMSLEEQNRAFTEAIMAAAEDIVPAKVSVVPKPRTFTAESAARILAGVRLAEALPLVRAALVEAGINLPEIELIPDGAAKRKYTVKVKQPVLDHHALADAIGKALARQMLQPRDIARMADLPTQCIDSWIVGQYMPTDTALARLDATLRNEYPNLFPN